MKTTGEDGRTYELSVAEYIELQRLTAPPTPGFHDDGPTTGGALDWGITLGQTDVIPPAPAPVPRLAAVPDPEAGAHDYSEGPPVEEFEYAEDTVPAKITVDIPRRELPDAHMPAHCAHLELGPNMFRLGGQIFIPNSKAEEPVVKFFSKNKTAQIRSSDLARQLLPPNPTKRQVTAMQVHISDLAHDDRGILEKVPRSLLFRLTEHGRCAMFVTVGHPQQAVARWKLEGMVH